MPHPSLNHQTQLPHTLYVIPTFSRRQLGNAALLCLLILSTNLASAENWPCWRGPRGDGTSLETDTPTHWSGTANVAWKTPVPGEGHSSPIIWENQIFLTTAFRETQERALLSLDRKSGAVLWQQAVF